MRSSSCLVFALLLLAALTPAGAAAAGRAPRIKPELVRSLPQYFQANSVAVSPAGLPWFGVESEESGPALARVRRRALDLTPPLVRAPRGLTTALQFDPAGNLWFGSLAGGSGGSGPTSSLARRAADGTITEFRLEGDEPVESIAFGPDGEVWFTRSNYASGKIRWMTSAGTVTEVPLAGGDAPRSITAGPDGALWFVEPGAGQIGRITTDGEVTQFPIRFGGGTDKLAVDPRGVIWFTTDQGEVASISPTGRTGERGCPFGCGRPLEGVAIAPDHSLWVAEASGTCPGCGGGAGLLTQIEGTDVARIGPGVLRPPSGRADASASLAYER